MKIAGFWTRLMAYNIDFLFYLLFALILRLIIPVAWIMYFSLLLCIFLFEVAFLHSSYSATPGRKYMKIQVLNSEGEKLPLSKVLIRTITKFISIILFFVGYAMIAFRKDKRSLHDLAAGSIVVFK